MSELGHYDVTVHLRSSFDQPLHRTYPFGQWAEIGYWLDEIGATEGDSVAVTFHPLSALPGGSITCPRCQAVFAWEGEEPEDCLRCGLPLAESRALSALGESGRHSVRASLHEAAGLLDLEAPEYHRDEPGGPIVGRSLHVIEGPDMDAVARLEEFSRGLGEIDTTEED